MMRGGERYFGPLNIVVEMAIYGQKRIGRAMVLSPKIVLLTQSFWIIISLDMMVGFKHMVPNLRLVGFSQLHPTHLIDFKGIPTWVL